VILIRYQIHIGILCRSDKLQISQPFRASEKYSYGSYQQLRLICDKLEVSKISHQMPQPQYIV